ncbi:hypothetical protein [Kriegella aquimaris]|uniref:Uncharacterized protein n=1 Tax=Kriegella aquimaris TaxID=192904 RepID=A0A1G9WYL7_9FLAO|nr:hypothetical protein [Kriegella aquimaris]SDM89205.1 hypothetical protein SAMN04488514_116102 [Kriegella aquimaris]
MRNHYILMMLLLIAMSCNEKKRTNEAVAKAQISKSELGKGAMQLTLNGQTHVYNHIDWEKSRVKYDGENVSLRIRQKRLPIVKFRFPDIHKSLTEFSEFKIPDVMRGLKSDKYSGYHSPITLNFIVYSEKEGKKQEAITLRKGTLRANFDNDRLHVEFEGEGGPSLDSTALYPIIGTIDIQMKK